MLDPQKLIHYAIPLSAGDRGDPELQHQLPAATTSMSGNKHFDVAGIGLIHSLDDIRNMVLATNNSTPIRVSDVADVGRWMQSRASASSG